MKKLYRIANRIISVDAPAFYDDCPEWRGFQINNVDLGVNFDCDNVDFINVDCKISDDFQAAVGDYADVSIATQSVVFGSVRYFSRNALNYRSCYMHEIPGSLSVYDNKSNHSTTYYTTHSFKTMTDTRYLWTSISLPQLLLAKGVLLFHSSYICHNGKGYIFTGECGAGKSTQADLWREYRGAEVINGDKSALTVERGVPCVHGVPFCGTSGICKNESYPLGAIIFPVKASENSVKRITGVEAVRRLTENIYLDFLAPDELNMCIDILLNVLSTVPVYELRCTPDERAVQALDSVL